MSDRVDRFLAIASCVLGTLLLLGAALREPLHDSEGSFIYASLRVADGARPYGSLFHPDAPYGLYLNAPFRGNLLAARLFSALIGTGVLALLAFHLRGRPGATGALLLLATASPFLAWIPTATAQAPGLAAALGGYVLAVDPPSRRRLFASGICMGLAAGFHAPYALLLPVLVLWLALSSPERRRGALSFLAGSTMALLPCLLLFLISPGPAAWCVLGHADLASAPASPLKLALGPQWILLALLALVALSRGCPPDSALCLGSIVALGVPCFLPVFSQPGVPAILIPFLVLAAVPALEIRTRPALLAGLAVFALYLSHGPHDPSRPDDGHTPSMVGNTADLLRRQAQPGETVLAFWPGYAALSGTRLPTGMESTHSWISIDTRMKGPDGPAIAGKEEARSWIRDRRFRVVLLGRRRQRPGDVAHLTAELQLAGYHRLRLEWDRSLWLRE